VQGGFWSGEALGGLVQEGSTSGLTGARPPIRRLRLSVKTLIPAATVIGVIAVAGCGPPEPKTPAAATASTTTIAPAPPSLTVVLPPTTTSPAVRSTTVTDPTVPAAPSSPAPPGTTAGTRDRVVAQIKALTAIAPSAPSPYRRVRFGETWIDEDRDCHNTRAEVLLRDSLAPVTFRANGCTVDTGLWVDPWNGRSSTLASTFQVDHTVPLANAWVTGAWQWSDEERLRFANDLRDPDTLLALEGANNTAKSDKTPDQWRPALRTAWCRYADAWSRIKMRWQLTVTTAERDALLDLASAC
jgi:hypothetical protein